MQILADVTESRVLHTRTIQLHDAPKLLTGNYYGAGGEEYRPTALHLKWYGDEQPKTVDIDGVLDDGKPIKRSLGIPALAMPEWMKEILNPVPPKQVFEIVRKKSKTGAYSLIDKISGKKVAEAHLTGRYGADNYPWDWYLADGLTFGEGKANTGSCDTLWACIDVVQGRANTYGIVDSATLSKEKP